MGMYINPEGMTKETWLKDKGIPLPPGDEPKKLADAPEGYLPVCLVVNAGFTAAGICFSDDELEAFQRPDDLRPKLWLVVPYEDLISVSPEFARYMERTTTQG